MERDLVENGKVIKKSTISTHTLTWSVTASLFHECGGDIHFNSHAHVERDLTALLHCFLHLYFNSHAHVERDRHDVLLAVLFKISTHTLTWSVTRHMVATWR